MATAVPEEYREAFKSMLAAAAPVAGFRTAYEAEAAISMLLGGVYAKAAPEERRTLVTSVADEFVKFLGRRHTPESLAILGGLAAVAPGVAGERAAKAVKRFEERGVMAPPWVTHTGKVSCTGAWRIFDMYGDKSHFVVTYRYDAPAVGGPDHAVTVLIDHNRRSVVDVAVADPADDVVTGWARTLDQLTGAATMIEVPPGLARTMIEHHLPAAERMTEPPCGQRFLDIWALVVSRVEALPFLPDAGPPPPVDEQGRATVVRAFLDTPVAGTLALEMATSVHDPISVVARAARLIVDYAVEANSGDPLRWSPTAVRHLMLEWAPRQRDLPPEVTTWLPDVLKAYVQFAGDLGNVPEEGILATMKAVTDSTARYQSLTVGSPEGESMEQIFDKMLDAGVDPADDAAARQWLERYVARQDGPGHDHR
ncbi:MAG: hypothetical protein ACRDT6_18915 [Micromonosporaceae bacterium]